MSKRFADKLNGREYGFEMTLEEIDEAKGLGYVVVFGYSDDCMELRGAIHDEAGCWNGGKILLDKDGILEECECDCKHYQNAKSKAKIIEAVWNKEGYSWTYKTDIPHHAFEILEDGEKYCRGIVFDKFSLE